MRFLAAVSLALLLTLPASLAEDPAAPAVPRDAAWAKQELARHAEEHGVEERDRRLMERLLDRHLAAGCPPESAISRLIEVWQASRIDRSLLPDWAAATEAVMGDDQRGGQGLEFLEHAWETTFRPRAMVASQTAFEARLEFAGWLWSANVPEPEAILLRGIFLDLLGVTVDRYPYWTDKPWQICQDAWFARREDKGYIADLAKLVSDEVSKGTRRDPLYEVIESQLGARREAALAVLAQKRRALTDPVHDAAGAKAALLAFAELGGYSPRDLESLTRLLEDLLAAGIEPSKAIQTLEHGYHLGRGDSTLLASMAEHVHERVKAGARGEDVFAAEGELADRCDVAREAADAEVVYAMLEERMRILRVPKADADLVRGILADLKKARLYSPGTVEMCCGALKANHDGTFLADLAGMVREETSRGADAERFAQAFDSFMKLRKALPGAGK